MPQHLDFSIGPVQGFVAESRRTRDLWGSSYLLSFLSAQAIAAAQHAGGTIVRPGAVEQDPMILWLKSDKKSKLPTVGSLPNHFIVSVDGCSVEEVANQTTTAFFCAWNAVCDAVWSEFVAQLANLGHGTCDIWNRQIRSFWELQWVVTPEESSPYLTARKHWRTHHRSDEPGDKCTVMHNFQELSGYIRSQDKNNRIGQEKFWDHLRDNKKVGHLELRENERLCAIALIKRLYAKVAESALGGALPQERWPSTVYVGAIPWLISIGETGDTYSASIKKAARNAILGSVPIPNAHQRQLDSQLAKVDANYFHRPFLDDPIRCPVDDENTREELQRQLEQLYQHQNIGSPPVFYALLLADGDKLGPLVQTLGGQVVGDALFTFTTGCSQTVEAHQGVVIYAGGDDVMALVPVPGALSCAEDLRKNYVDAFGGKANPTLSCAVVFAHIRLPLHSVLEYAHRLLDHVAKTANGWNSLAVGVLKGGGTYCEWASTWDRLYGDTSISAVKLMEHLTHDMKPPKTEVGLSSSLLYRLRDTLGLLCNWAQWSPGKWHSPSLSEQAVRDFLKAEIRHSVGDEVPDDKVNDLTERTLSGLKPARAIGDGGPLELGMDGLMLARFLSTEGKEEH